MSLGIAPVFTSLPPGLFIVFLILLCVLPTCIIIIFILLQWNVCSVYKIHVSDFQIFTSPFLGFRPLQMKYVICMSPENVSCGSGS